jgi:hypothetical protein
MARRWRLIGHFPILYNPLSPLCPPRPHSRTTSHDASTSTCFSLPPPRRIEVILSRAGTGVGVGCTVEEELRNHITQCHRPASMGPPPGWVHPAGMGAGPPLPPGPRPPMGGPMMGVPMMGGPMMGGPSPVRIPLLLTPHRVVARVQRASPHPLTESSALRLTRLA